MKRIALAICLAACLAGQAQIPGFESLPNGNWVRRPTKDGGHATLIIETAGTGRKLTFKIEIAGGVTTTMVVTTQGDGKDAQVFVDGKPSVETMAIRTVDGRHTINIVKMDGKPIATQNSELSADGKVIKVDSRPSVAGAQIVVEYWDRK
jgi:hypothetical protein